MAPRRTSRSWKTRSSAGGSGSTREAFLDYVGATNLIPGPNSTELAIAIGRDRAGWPGLIVAGVVVHCAGGRDRDRGRVGVRAVRSAAGGAGVLAGVKPVVIAIVAQALWRLGAHRA